MPSKSYRIEQPRDLTAEERELLVWMIDHGKPQAAKHRPQLPKVAVAGTCGCGCPTIDLVVDGKNGSGKTEIISDVVGFTPDGMEVGVILFSQGGLLSALEVYAFGDHECSFGLPKLDTLVPFPTESTEASQ